MERHNVRVGLTFYDDSMTVSYFVEHDSEGERWELWSEGISTPSSVASDVSNELHRLIWRLMDAPSSSTSRTS